MENSCRKNLKQSSKKWVLASCYPKFRRNLCLRSTNAGLFHYAGNNPVRYIDPDGREDKELLKNERAVKEFLQTIADSPENYDIKVYQRRALKPGKRTPTKTHSLYVIYNKTTKEKSTISFNGTRLFFFSKGAWGKDTKTDVEGLVNYEKGNNNYDMELLMTPDIDNRKTVLNIINSIDSDITYYALDHKNNMKNKENCNTALYNTIVFAPVLKRVRRNKNEK